MSDDVGVAEPDADNMEKLSVVADAALARLDVDDLLVELLERVQSILVADTAAVLLRDGESGDLVARAAWGLEEEVRQGARVPIGTGFAGAIAARRQPVTLDRVDATTVSNPILWELGIQVMLGVPLLAGDELLGVLHVGRLSARPFTEQDAALLQVAAERVASAFQARRLAVESAAARLLERGLQPARLPILPGLKFAARYVPAESRAVGGDWYDAFTLPSGQLWVVTGDVAGHGLNAAVVMGRVKSALRSYALVAAGAVEAVEAVDHKIHHFEIGAMVTLVCATSDPPYREFQICSAGHPPPVLAADGEEPRLVELMVGPPLGVLPGVKRSATTVEVPPGGVLLLYTDGLVERRDESLTDGLERLRSAVTGGDPETVCRAVMHDLIGGQPAIDDVALLALQRPRIPVRPRAPPSRRPDQAGRTAAQHLLGLTTTTAAGNPRGRRGPTLSGGRYGRPRRGSRSTAR